MADKSRSVLVKGNGGYTLVLEPGPTISISETLSRNEAAFLNVETTLTLNGVVLPGCVADDVFSVAACDTKGSSNPKAQDYSRSVMNEVFRIRQFFIDSNVVDIKINNGAGRSMASYAGCLVESFNVEEGSWQNKANYQVVLKSYQGVTCQEARYQSGAGRLAANQTFVSLSPRDSGVLTDYSETFSIEPVVGEYGGSSAKYDDNGPKISSTYYKGSVTISVSAKSMGSRRLLPTWLKKNPPSDGDTDYKTTGWEIARDLFSELHGDPTDLDQAGEYYLNEGLFNYGYSQASANQNFEIYNLSRRQSIDAGTGTFSITDDFIIAEKDSKALETFTCSYDSSNDSISPTVTIQGTIKGLTQLSIDDQSRLYVDYDKNTPSPGPSSMIDNALVVYNHLSNDLQYGATDCPLFERAQVVSPVNLNPGPRSISFSTNDVAGEVNYTLEYDARPFKFFNGAITENINVEDTLPGDSYTVIPVFGRKTGPILQYLYGRTEYRRTLSIEVVFDTSVVPDVTSFPNATRDNMIATKPSLRTGFREQLAALVSTYSPANDNQIATYFQDPPVETWNQSECRYTCQISWVYELNV